MTAYDPNILEEIEKNVDLLEYVSQNIEMRQQGAEYFGSCPLHVDKTPSFSVTPSKNKFYCFSCGNGGGIISFLMKYENMCFDDAVQKAAELGNVDMSKMCQSQTVAFLRSTIKRNQKKECAAHDIIPNAEWEKYQPGEINEWIDEGIRQEELDYFDIRLDNKTNRIVYPVRDIEGNLINIKGRTRFPNYKLFKIAKYINYFKVGCLDYFQCLDKTKEFVTEKGEVVIFESIKSVMKCFGWGYKHCVSAENHTLTDEQIRLLVKMRVDVVFAYDKDVNYFAKGTWEQIEKLKKFTNVYIIEDKENLLGSKEQKNSPADLGQEVWEKLYKKKRRII